MKLINERLIEIHSPLRGKEEIIKRVAGLLFAEKRITDMDGFIADLYEREEELSTSMGLGIAIPHAKSCHVRCPSLVFIKLEDPVPWNEDNVRLIFGIAVSKEQAGDMHLKILSQLARKLMNDRFRDTLFGVSDCREAYAALAFLNGDAAQTL